MLRLAHFADIRLETAFVVAVLQNWLWRVDGIVVQSILLVLALSVRDR
jgi:hypothetical protein